MNSSGTRLPMVIGAMAQMLLTGMVQAQERGNAGLDSALAHHRFVFLAHWATAYSGQRKALTPPYELSVTSDSIACYLPYLGRMYTAPNPQEQRFMSISFISRKFAYSEHVNGRMGWDITIRPRDARDVQVLNFSIPRKGWAILTIRSAGRDRMTYEGTVGPLPD